MSEYETTEGCPILQYMLVYMKRCKRKRALPASALLKNIGNCILNRSILLYVYPFSLCLKLFAKHKSTRFSECSSKRRLNER